MTAAELNKEIKAGIISGAYIFHGEEDYLKNHYMKEIRKAVLGSDDLNDLNYVRFNAENYSLSALASAIETLPCFAEKKLIEVYDLDFISMNDEELQQCSAVLAKLSFYDYNVLVFFTRPFEFSIGNYKGKQLIYSKAMKVLSESKTIKTVAFDFETESRLCSWIVKHFNADGVFASDSNAKLIIQFCGKDMYSLSNEISKLCSYLHSSGKDALSSEDIELICIRNREYGSFAFANAILDGNTDLAYAVLSKIKEQKEKPEYILSNISSCFSNMYLVKVLSESGLSKQDISSKLKMHEYTVGLYQNCVRNKSSKKLSKLLERCYEADIKLKSSSLDSGELLDKLVISTVGL